MRYRLLLAALAFAPAVAAQGLTLATQVLDPTQNFVLAASGSSLERRFLPPGPVAFPVHLATAQNLVGPRASLDLGQASSGAVTTLTVRELGVAGTLESAQALCRLHSTVTMPLPARVSLAIDHRWLGWVGGFPLHQASVDIGADGSLEYYSQNWWLNLPALEQREFLVDARGTPVQVDALLQAPGSGSGALAVALDLHYTAPQQEPAYGAPCGAEFGCQLDATNPFARTLVASLPGNSILAWFVGGDQQANVIVPGFACPLLTNNVVVISVPIQPGSNGRSMAVLDVVLPPLPGAVWYAQGIAFANGTFAGSNGVRIQT